MKRNLYKSVKERSFNRLISGLLVFLMSWQFPVSADPVPTANNRVEQPGITVQQNEDKKSGSATQAPQTSNDFLSGGNTLNAEKTLSTNEQIALVVDGAPKSPKTQNGKTTITVSLSSQLTEKNRAFLEKAAGPLNVRPNATSLTITLSSDGRTIEKTEFTANGIKYETTLGSDLTITGSTVTNLNDPLDLKNNFTIQYAADKTIIKFSNSLSDGTIRMEITQSAGVMTIRDFYDETPDSYYKVVTVTSNSDGSKSINSTLQFPGVPDILEYNATVMSGNLTAMVPTSFGDVPANLTDLVDLYDTLDKMSAKLENIAAKDYLLSMFQYQLGGEFFTTADILNNIVVHSEQEPVYAVLTFMGFPLVMTCNTDPETYEAKPLILMPDINRNGVSDSGDARIVARVWDTAKKFFTPGEAIEYEDFADNAIILDSKTVFYRGEIIVLERRGANILRLTYSDHEVTIEKRRRRGRRLPRLSR